MPKGLDVNRLLGLAEECRILAGIVTEESAAKSYLRVAEFYEAIAKEERMVAVPKAARTDRFQKS
jgi:hypothetical protein